MSSRLWYIPAGLVALAGFAQWSGLTGIRTPAERSAIAQLRAPLPELGERNAFPALWLSRFDMPEASYQAQTNEDVSRWRELRAIQDPRARAQRRRRFTSAAQGRYPELPSVGVAAALCSAWEPECVRRVRADPVAAVAALTRMQPYLGRIDRLLGYDHLSNPFVREGPPTSPQLAASFAALLSDAALRHVAAEPGAESRLCTAARQFRNLRAHADDLALMSSIQTLLAAAVRVHAEIRAELPPGTRAEPDCGPAFAPLAEADFDLCPAFRREYQAPHETSDTTALSGPEGPGLLERIGWETYDRTPDDPRWARLLASSYCADERAGRARARARLGYDSNLLLCNAGERVFRPALCASAEVASFGFGSHWDQLLDLDARFALTELGEALALLPVAERGAAFDRRERLPIEDTHPFSLEPGLLSAPLLVDSRFEERIEVPVPGTRIPAAQAEAGPRR